MYALFYMFYNTNSVLEHVSECRKLKREPELSTKRRQLQQKGCRKPQRFTPSFPRGKIKSYSQSIVPPINF